MKTTIHKLNEIKCRMEAEAHKLQRLNATNVGSLTPVLYDDSPLCAVRAEFIAALQSAGPRLRAKFGFDEINNNFNPDGSVR